MSAPTGMWIKIALLLLAVFSLGTVAGAVMSQRYRSTTDTTGRDPSIRDGEAYVAVLDRELHLNPDQAAAMKTILEQTKDDYKGVCAEVRPKYNDVRDHARARLRAVLQPDQQAKFDGMISPDTCNCPDQKKP